MDTLNLIFVLLVCVGTTRIMSNIVPIPLPIIQILLGCLMASPIFNIHVEMDPAIFFLLFIPPLLFYDGWKISKRDFMKMSAPILAMAFGLALIITLSVGFLIHWMLPSIPLAACFALAAVLSPTDALAVSAIAHGKLPKPLMNMLEGEALMNDASGLVAFKFALAACITGMFSWHEASFQFVWVAVSGLIIGAGMSYTMGKVKARMNATGLTDSSTHVVMMLLLPFMAYYVAEHAGASGILSAVAAGMMQSRVDLLPKQTQTRILNRSLWSVLEFIFNGVVFILLGIQFPSLMGGAFDGQGISGVALTDVLLVIGAVVGVMMLIRFGFFRAILWVWGKTHAEAPAWAVKPCVVSALVSFAGIRGAITLAAILSIPLMIGSEPFPARELLIFIACGVIVVSLLLGAVGIPVVLKFMPALEDDQHAMEKMFAQREMMDEAIKEIERWEHDTCDKQAEPVDMAMVTEIAARVLIDYRQDLESFAMCVDERQRAQTLEAMEKDLRMRAIKVQRLVLFNLKKKRHIDDDIMIELMRELDYDEAALL